MKASGIVVCSSLTPSGRLLFLCAERSSASVSVVAACSVLCLCCADIKQSVYAAKNRPGADPRGNGSELNARVDACRSLVSHVIAV